MNLSQQLAVVDFLKDNQKVFNNTVNIKEAAEYATRILEFTVPRSTIDTIRKQDIVRWSLPKKKPINASVTHSADCQTLAKALCTLYHKLGESPPKDVSALATGLLPEDIT